MKHRVSPQAIETVIATLFAAEKPALGPDAFPSVRQIARALKAQYGFSGENKRICEALRRARESRAPDTIDPNDERLYAAWRFRALTLAKDLTEYQARIDQLEQALATMTARAELSEFREEATQSRLMMEVDRIRQQLADAESRRPRGVDPEVHLLVCRELAAAKQEIADLKATRCG